MHELTDIKVKNAKPRQKPYKLFDGGGLYLLVNTKGTRGWRYKYRFAGREKLISFGVYPTVPLAGARAERDKAQKQVAAGDDPSVLRQIKKAKEKAAKANTFEAIAQTWSDEYHKDKSEATQVRNMRILKYLNADLGGKPIKGIKGSAVKSALVAIKKKHGTETAHRGLWLARMIFEDAASDDLISIDPTFGLNKKLGEVVDNPRAALTKPAEVGKLLRGIWAYHGQPTTVAALKLLAHTFLRPGELRKAEWSEINFDNGEWIIPIERMKMRRKNPFEHLVPLSTQTLEILTELHKHTGDGDLVFPTNRPGRPLSENSFRVALQTMGYDGKHTGHGFRKTASTILTSLNFDSRFIEKQLAHSVPGVQGIYNLYAFGPERKAMMQTWSDHLDSLRTGAKVTPIKKVKVASDG